MLCYELIIGDGLKPHSPAERAFLAAGEKLKAAAELQMRAAGVACLEDLHEHDLPKPHSRAARVNLLKITMAEALEHFRDSSKPGWQANMQVDFSRLRIVRSNMVHC